ncbi:GNAT family N-acetyltransferase [Rudaeicoccus suwonensis]|uniref:Putative N-acetyltransferase YhbS n=1 Tax=Rudaeicoccus suwonensis TaxID=657409 RepID=A0A561EAI8_9MICO|nr:GNAT family N-acetyltransferase [Rudaeicoccus suwonensis]TWE12619.1 putative N-acetyltransferase YhbS [Rudaeicoccus suwonensis]
MARQSVQVVRARPEDESSFAQLWTASRAATGLSAKHAEKSVRDGRLGCALRRADVRVYLATSDGEAVGYVMCMQGPVGALSDELAVWIDLIWVDPARRGGGVARALLGMVVEFADHIGAVDIVSCVPAGERELNRYFARLGFSSVVTERTTTPAALRRRLAGGPVSMAAEAVRRRRSLRARARGQVAMVREIQTHSTSPF